MRRFFKLPYILIALVIISAVPVSAMQYRDAGIQAPAKKEPLVLSFTGDMMAHVINYSMKDYSLIYRDIESIMQNDSLTFSNVEFPVNPEIPQASYPVFNIHPEYVMAAIDAGVDVVSIANNHTADQGVPGLQATVSTMYSLMNYYKKQQNRELHFSGAKDNPETDFKPVTIYKNGWKIGYLAVAQFSNHNPGRGYMQLVDFRDREETSAFVDFIKKVRTDYDLFVLAYHGGVEYLAEPVKAKTEFFNDLVAAGVDIIWGHHPHIIQPVDIVTTEGRTGVVMNSLGNFISGQGRIIDPDLPEEEWSYTGDSAIIQVEAAFRNGRIVFDRVEAIPTANMMTTNREVVITPLEQLTHQPVPQPWNDFFMQRYMLMHDYFNRNIRQIDLTGSR